MAKGKNMTIGLLGTGKASIKSASALIADLTESAAEVTFIVPVTEKHFTSDIEAILEWAHDEGHKYEAVLDDDSADVKELADYIEAAEKTYKVARPEVKVVNLLERAENGKLLMLWDDEDENCMSALERAVDREVPALDLTNGLDALEFDEPKPDGDGEVVKPPAGSDDGDEDGTPERSVPAADDPAAEFAPQDDLDSYGVRKLRDMVEEELKMSRRKVGQMSKDDCIAALREARGGAKTAPAAPEQEDDGDEAQQPTPRRERATRDEDVTTTKAAPAKTTAAAPPHIAYQLRVEALALATRANDATHSETVARAQTYLRFLQG